MECLQNIVGLSTNDCNCFDTDRPTDYNISKSGLYIDDIKGLSLFKSESYTECGDGSVWDILERARQRAIEDFTTDFLARIMKSNKLARPQIRGDVGQRIWRSNGSSSTFQGIKLCVPVVKGGCLYIHNIRTLFNDSGVLSLDIYRVLDGDFTELVQTVSLNTASNTLTDNEQTTPIELSLEDNDCERLEYYFVYNRGSNIPKNNGLDCNCKYKKWDSFGSWFSVDGWNNTALDFTNGSKDSKAHGLQLDIEAKCKLSTIICDDELCFDNDPFAKVIAYAILYKAGIYLMDYFSGSSQINRYTMLGAGDLHGNKKQFIEEYHSRLSYLEDNMPTDKTDCIICGGKSSMRTGTIIA